MKTITLLFMLISFSAFAQEEIIFSLSTTENPIYYTIEGINKRGIPLSINSQIIGNLTNFPIGGKFEANFMKNMKLYGLSLVSKINIGKRWQITPSLGYGTIWDNTGTSLYNSQSKYYSVLLSAVSVNLKYKLTNELYILPTIEAKYFNYFPLNYSDNHNFSILLGVGISFPVKLFPKK